MYSRHSLKKAVVTSVMSECGLVLSGAADSCEFDLSTEGLHVLFGCKIPEAGIVLGTGPSCL